MCYSILYSQKNALVNKSFFIKFMLSYLLFLQLVRINITLSFSHKGTGPYNEL